jgi:hypothetical protein
MLLVILEEIDRQGALLRDQQYEMLPGRRSEKILDLMNRAEYHPQQLEASIQKPS